MTPLLPTPKAVHDRAFSPIVRFAWDTTAADMLMLLERDECLHGLVYAAWLRVHRSGPYHANPVEAGMALDLLGFARRAAQEVPAP